MFYVETVCGCATKSNQPVVVESDLAKGRDENTWIEGESEVRVGEGRERERERES